MPYGAEKAEILDLSSILLRRKRSDLFIMFEMRTGRISINPFDFFDYRLTKNIRGKLTPYVSVAKSQVRTSAFTHRGSSTRF